MAAVTHKKLHKKVNASLVKFADCLVPSDTFSASGRELVQNVFEHLKRELRRLGISVSHTYIGGSFGKNTSVIFPDFDCVVFLNNTEPPLNREIQYIKDILSADADLLNIDASSIGTSDSTVKLKFKSGVEMDLLPACNYNQYDRNEQYRQVLLRIQNPENFGLAWQFSSSLAPMQIDFLREQSGPTHQLIRIAKYWYKSGYFWSYGGSAIIEILCVCTTLDLNNKFSLVDGFRHFLSEYISELDYLRIGFYRSNGRWRRVAEEDLGDYGDHFDPQILDRVNFIIEPANPYNDLAPNLSDNLQDIKRYGRVMLTRLDELTDLGNNAIKWIIPRGGDFAVDIVYRELLEPYKLNIRNFYPQNAIPTRAYYQYDYDWDTYWYTYGPDQVKVHNQQYFTKNPEAKWVYENILTNLLFLFRARARFTLQRPLTFQNGLPVIDDSEDVLDAVQSFTNASFGNRHFAQVSRRDQDHEGAFVTLTVPYVLYNEKVAVRYSLAWHEPQSLCAIS